MFYFQSMFQQVYNGITGSAVLPAVQQIAEGILLLAALFAVYEAYAKGGDARTLALAGVRYLIMGLLISQYPNVFRNVNNAFASVAQAIAPTASATSAITGAAPTTLLANSRASEVAFASRGSLVMAAPRLSPPSRPPFDPVRRQGRGCAQD